MEKIVQEGSESFSGPADSLLTGLDMSHIRLCPAIAFNQIIGGRYKLHILCVLNRGSHRYGEIGRSLLKGGLGKPITPRILSRELKELEQRGLIDRKVYGGAAQGGIQPVGSRKGAPADLGRNHPLGSNRRP
jgi:DNA-binding transcriptional ArsR family regulator